MIVTFEKDKETKNTVRFVAPMGGEVSGSIYVQKGSVLAKETTLSIEVLENQPA